MTAANPHADPPLYRDLRAVSIQIRRLEPYEVAAASVQRAAGSEAPSRHFGA